MAAYSKQVEFTFEAGEDVLCFEPDPSKARVLYEAKVLDCITEKYEGQFYPTYWIHFKGWKARWDRYVLEQEILKRTQQNLNLKEKLSSIVKQVKGNKTRKRRIEEVLRKALNTENSSSDGTKSDDSDGETSSSSESEEEAGVVAVEIAQDLKTVLEDDLFKIKNSGMVHSLPAEPCVVSILESYVRSYASSHLLAVDNRKRAADTHINEAFRLVRLCKEVAVGLRTCFDFYLKDQLLYDEERDQYQHIITKPEEPAPPDLTPILATPAEQPLIRRRTRRSVNSEHTPEEPNRKSRRCSKPTPATPATPDLVRIDTTQHSTPNTQKHFTARTPPSCAEDSGVGGEFSQRAVAELSRLTHWSLDDDDPVGPQVPDGTVPPSTVYGGLHLTRMLVRLPELLNMINMPVRKTDVMNEHLRHLQSFLCERPDLYLSFTYTEVDV